MNLSLTQLYRASYDRTLGEMAKASKEGNQDLFTRLAFRNVKAEGVMKRQGTLRAQQIGTNLRLLSQAQDDFKKYIIG